MVRYISGILVNRYEVLTAENGKQGIDIAIDRIPDLIITDLMMPEMDGVEMCLKIKEDERTSHIPVIMLTAKADRDSKLEGLKTGSDDYLIKPFDPEELQVRAQNLIEQRKRLKAAFMEEFRKISIDEMPESQDDRLLNRILDILKENIGNSDYNVEQIGEVLHMSRAQVFRKIGALTGSSPGDLLRIMRLKKAAELLLTGNLNIAQVMYEVGYQTPAYFARRFREYYGMNPSEYQSSKKAY
jgi:YesN/AraC family two-component response regulator